MLRRAAQRDVPTVAARILGRTACGWPITATSTTSTGITEARLESVSLDREKRIRGFPVQVDGDYIGNHGELDLGIAPGALTIVA